MSRIDRHIFKGRLIRRLYPKRKLLAIQNYIECEAHWEVVKKGLNQNITIEEKKISIV